MRYFERAFDDKFLAEEAMQNPFSRKFDGGVPPPLGDDSALLAEVEVRRQRKNKAARKMELVGALTKR